MLDYTQYYLNLTEANLNGRAEWRRAYNFTQLYGMPDVSALALHNVATGMLTQPGLFANYYAANHLLKDGAPFCGSLCRQVHFCAATQVTRFLFLSLSPSRFKTALSNGVVLIQIDYADYDDCIAKALMAASSSSRAAVMVVHFSWPTTLFVLVVFLATTGR